MLLPGHLEAALNPSQTKRLQVNESAFKWRTSDTFDTDLCQVLVYSHQNQRGTITEVSWLGCTYVHVRPCKECSPSASMPHTKPLKWAVDASKSYGTNPCSSKTKPLCCLDGSRTHILKLQAAFSTRQLCIWLHRQKMYKLIFEQACVKFRTLFVITRDLVLLGTIRGVSPVPVLQFLHLLCYLKWRTHKSSLQAKESW